MVTAPLLDFDIDHDNNNRVGHLEANTIAPYHPRLSLSTTACSTRLPTFSIVFNDPAPPPSPRSLPHHSFRSVNTAAPQTLASSLARVDKSQINPRSSIIATQPLPQATLAYSSLSCCWCALPCGDFPPGCPEIRRVNDMTTTTVVGYSS